MARDALCHNSKGSSIPALTSTYSKQETQSWIHRTNHMRLESFSLTVYIRPVRRASRNDFLGEAKEQSLLVRKYITGKASSSVFGSWHSKITLSTSLETLLGQEGNPIAHLRCPSKFCLPLSCPSRACPRPVGLTLQLPAPENRYWILHGVSDGIRCLRLGNNIPFQVSSFAGKWGE